MNRNKEAAALLCFPLDVEDGWPPVGSESIPCLRVGENYMVQVAPLFVGNLSVDDVISVVIDEEGNVKDWKQVSPSSRTTIWLLRLERPNGIATALEKLRELGCNTVTQDSLGAYSIDVPSNVGIADVDAILDHLDPNEAAVAFPSMRHPDVS